MITGNKIRLRKKRLSDARNDYAWKTDAELVELDAAEVLTVSFPHFLLDYTSQLRFSSSISQNFAVETLDGKHIGNCSYYNIDEDKGEAELGIMIGDRDYWNKGYGTDLVTTLVNHVFQDTNSKRLYLKSLDWNLRAQQCYKKCGFTPCGNLYRDGHSFVTMEIHRQKWAEQQIKKKQPVEEKKR